MRSFAVAAAAAALGTLFVAGALPADADVLVNVSKTSQRMSVLVDGTARYNWKVSTGAKRYATPNGVYKPQWLARRWKSRQYNNAPMPHSIFFHKGYAIHGTTEVARLGRIASHGCVRLAPENAAKLYAIVQGQMANTRIVVSNDVIDMPGEAPTKKPPGQIMAKKPVEPAKPAARPPVAVEAMALAQASAAPEKPSTVEKIEAKAPVREVVKVPIREEVKAPIREEAKAPVREEVKAPVREVAKPRLPRRDRFARSDSRPGFHW